MITCPICGIENDPSNRFCDQCGSVIKPGGSTTPAPQSSASASTAAAAGAASTAGATNPSAAMTCPGCQAPILPGEVFCESCGLDLVHQAESAPAPAPIPASVDEPTMIATPIAIAPSPPPPADTEETWLVGSPPAWGTPSSPTSPEEPPVSPSAYTEETIMAPAPVPDAPAPIPNLSAYTEETIMAVVPAIPAAPVTPPGSAVPAAYTEETMLASEPAIPGISYPEPPASSPSENQKSEEQKRIEEEVQRHRGTVGQMEKMLRSYPPNAQTPEFLIQGLEGARRALAQAEARLASLSSGPKGPDPAKIQRIQTLINVHKDTIAQFEQMQRSYPPDAIPQFLIDGLNEANRALIKAKADLATLRGTEPFGGPSPDAVAISSPDATPQPEPVSGPRLELFQGKHILPLPLDKHDIIIGRADPVSAIYPEIDLTGVGGEAGGVSRQHAKLSHKQGLWSVTDLHSTNHTRVDGQKIEPENPVPIQDGTRLQFGRIAAIFRLV